MAGDSAIEWTDATWNPVTGCTRVSPGCAHCYALELAPRLRKMGVQRYIDAADGGRGSGPAFGVTMHPDILEQPLRWRRPRRVFVNSMSDLFHEDIPDEYIADVFAVMAAAPQHTFQILTKRPDRMREVLRSSYFFLHLLAAARGRGLGALEQLGEYPLPNVWLGVSIENRRYVHRADDLRAAPAAVRFISAEPLLGPLIPCGQMTTATNATASGEWAAPETIYHWRDGRRNTDPGLDLDGIDWLIVGGESGARARPLNLDWARDLRGACERTGTAFFFKQVGGRTPKAGGRELDGRTHDSMPEVTPA